MFLNIKKMTVLYSAVIFFVLIIFDRGLKLAALYGLKSNLAGEWLKFNLAKNYYIAFSLPASGVWLNFLIGLIISALACWLTISWRAGQLTTALGLAAVIFGALSNYFDRLKHGFVIDYLDLKYFTAFNLADALIVAGVIYLFVGIKKQPA